MCPILRVQNCRSLILQRIEVAVRLFFIRSPWPSLLVRMQHILLPDHCNSPIYPPLCIPVWQIVPRNKNNVSSLTTWLIEISGEIVYPHLLSDFANLCNIFNVTLILHSYRVTNLPAKKHAAEHSLLYYIFISRNGRSPLAFSYSHGFHNIVLLDRLQLRSISLQNYNILSKISSVKLDCLREIQFDGIWLLYPFFNSC